MKLSKIERLMLVNQCLILEKLYPENAVYYARHRTAFAEGYALHYHWALENIQDELSEEQCKEVVEILRMYRAITFSSKLNATERITKHRWFRFKGFDINDELESKLYGYVEYFVTELNRFGELKYEGHSDFNSRELTLTKYRKMLNVWRNSETKSETKYELTEDEIIKILDA
jgi:uncharacterized protein YfbU (UPF0304 family)